VCLEVEATDTAGHTGPAAVVSAIPCAHPSDLYRIEDDDEEFVHLPSDSAEECSSPQSSAQSGSAQIEQLALERSASHASHFALQSLLAVWRDVEDMEKQVQEANMVMTSFEDRRDNDALPLVSGTSLEEAGAKLNRLMDTLMGLQEGIATPPECFAEANAEKVVVAKHVEDIAARLETVSGNLMSLFERHASMAMFFNAPSVPGGLVVSPGDSSGGLSYAVVSFDEVPEAEQYVVRWQEVLQDGSTPRDRDGSTIVSKPPAIVTDLKTATKYQFTVTASNPAGESAESAEEEAVMISRPGPPENVTVKGSSSSRATVAVVRFDPPRIDGGSQVVEYVVRWCKGLIVEPSDEDVARSATTGDLYAQDQDHMPGFEPESQLREVTADAHGGTIMVDLSEAGEYRFVVCARNAMVEGTESNAVFLTVPPKPKLSPRPSSDHNDDMGCFGPVFGEA